MDPNDKSVTCLVCGKIFPRGHVDLARHMAAITLKHQVKSKQKGSFTFNCGKCSIYFASKEHLDLHTQLVCPGKAKGKKASATNTAKSAGGTGKNNLPGSEEDLNSMLDQDEQADRTVECMVCGKLFPRGAIDLQRHATAITLRHAVHTRRTQAFPYGCDQCGLHFATEEFLTMHSSLSSCNPNMVWPPFIAPGCKCITKEEHVTQAAAAPKGGEKATGGKKLSPSSRGAVAPSQGKLTKGKDTIDASTKSAKHNRSGSLTDSSLHALTSYYVAGADKFQPKAKKAKIIIPEDRKAFFAVVSLLIDPKEVPENVKLTEDNYETYIPRRHKKLVDKMKSKFFYTC